MNPFVKLFSYLEAKFGRPRLSIWRTLYANLRLLPFKQALHFPVRIYGRVMLTNLNGRIEITAHAKNVRLDIGRNIAGYVNTAPGRLYIADGATLRVGNEVKFSQGSNVCICKGACLEVGEYSTLGDNAKIICYRHIKIGKHSGLTWETQTTDFNSHFIEDCNTNQIYPIVKEVAIGDYCWIGNRTTVMPGTKLPDRGIVTSNSLLNKDYTSSIPSYSLIGGIPAKLLRTNVRRIYELDRERDLLNSLCQVQEP